jgi:hypothetical protein
VRNVDNGVPRTEDGRVVIIFPQAGDDGTVTTVGPFLVRSKDIKDRADNPLRAFFLGGTFHFGVVTAHLLFCWWHSFGRRRRCQQPLGWRLWGTSLQRDSALVCLPASVTDVGGVLVAGDSVPFLHQDIVADVRGVRMTGNIVLLHSLTSPLSFYPLSLFSLLSFSPPSLCVLSMGTAG